MVAQGRPFRLRRPVGTARRAMCSRRTRHASCAPAVHVIDVTRPLISLLSVSCSARIAASCNDQCPIQTVRLDVCGSADRTRETTDSAQRYPGYVTRGEARVLLGIRL
eukprot:5225916-Prymnesium_polylepis.1